MHHLLWNWTALRIRQGPNKQTLTLNAFIKLLQQGLTKLKSYSTHLSTESPLRGLTSMGYSSSIRLRLFPWRVRPSSSWSGESEGSGGGGEWARARDWPGEPPGAFRSRSTRREMVGEVPVRSATAWSCLASVMSTPLIWIDSETNHGGCQATRTLQWATFAIGIMNIEKQNHAENCMLPSVFSLQILHLIP